MYTDGGQGRGGQRNGWWVVCIVVEGAGHRYTASQPLTSSDLILSSFFTFMANTIIVANIRVLKLQAIRYVEQRQKIIKNQYVKEILQNILFKLQSILH